VDSIVSSRNRNWLAAGTNLGYLKIWDIETGHEAGSKKMPTHGYVVSVATLAESPDAKCLAVGRSDGGNARTGVRLVDTKTWRIGDVIRPSGDAKPARESLGGRAHAILSVTFRGIQCVAGYSEATQSSKPTRGNGCTYLNPRLRNSAAMRALVLRQWIWIAADFLMLSKRSCRARVSAVGILYP
jgi:WD40 repeat protein